MQSVVVERFHVSAGLKILNFKGLLDILTQIFLSKNFPEVKG